MTPKRYARFSKTKGSPICFTPKVFAIVLTGMLSSCGSSSVHIPVATTGGPQLYMTPVVGGSAGSATVNPATYSIDDKAFTFAQQTYAFSDTQSGAQIQYSGNLASPGLSRNLLELEFTYACGTTSIFGCSGVAYNPPQTGSGWAVELPNQSGGLLQLTGQPFVPLVPAVTCPSMSSAETFLFVTLPSRLITSGTSQNTWNPQMETAYGSVDISATGSTVTLANIKQYLLPSAGGGVPADAPAVTGACSPTVFGNTIAIPAQQISVTSGNGTSTISPQAMMGIGPSGLLVEDNGTVGHGNSSPYYENSLGAGTGAIGLPKPSSAVDTGSLIGAQYLGFFYGGGTFESATNLSSQVASFGFSNLPSTCSAVTPRTPTMLYGGDYTGNNPAASAVQANGGFGNCDFAIDLGAQDSSNNGLYPAAKVYVGSSFAANTTGVNYSFPAVAIAGQLQGKYAIFLIGVDSIGSPNQAWGIYLLQSN